MVLVNRVARLFRADLHAVIDRIEEPEILLRQAVRDMEEELCRGEQRIKIKTHELAQLQTRRASVEQALSELVEQLDVCFASNKDDLARALIKRKLEAERFHKHLSRKLADLRDCVADQSARLDENRSHLDSMRQKAELLTEDTIAERPQDIWNDPSLTVRDEDVEVAFLREKQTRNPS